MSQVPLYDDFAPDYDRFVDWPARLARELPFLEATLGKQGAQRVLDAACGTGHHALALAGRGYQAAGADLSPRMIEEARTHAQAMGLAVRFEVAGFGSLAQTFAQPFDAVLCLGNSLPHLLTPQAVRSALADFAATLRPGGVLVIQNRNYDRVWRERERFMPLESRRAGEQEWLFFRFMDFHQATLTFNLVTLERRGEGWTYRVGSTELRPLLQEELAAWLAQAGFGQIRFYGSYAGEPFDAQTSGDLIAVAVLSGPGR